MITIQINDREVSDALAELQRRVSDMRPAMHQVGEALLEGVKRHIEQGRDWAGRPFAPNSPATLSRKKGVKPLVHRGDFLSSCIHYAAGRDHVEIGASAVQSAVLQVGAKKGAAGRSRRGAPIPWGDIPPRPYLPIRDGDQVEHEAERLVIDIIRAYLA